MDQAYLRNFARRCRELMRQARSKAARDQLCLWAEEFDAHADSWDESGAAATSDTPEVAQPAASAIADPPLREASR